MTAWRHHCGQLNDGPWPTEDGQGFCFGCRLTVKRLEEIEGRFILGAADTSAPREAVR